MLRESKWRRRKETPPKMTQATIVPLLPLCIPWLTIFRGILIYTLSQVDKEGAGRGG